MANSLDAAVSAGIISRDAAFCGLRPADILNLRHAGFDNATVLARFHTGRAVLSVRDFALWQYVGGPLRGTQGENLWSADLRDVSALALALPE